MKIRNIILIIYLVSGIIFLSNSHPLYRNVEVELKKINETKESDENDYFHSDYVGNKKHIYHKPEKPLKEKPSPQPIEKELNQNLKIDIDTKENCNYYYYYYFYNYYYYYYYI